MIEVSAPLRLPLGGGGTDLPSYYERRGGLVVSAALRDAVRVRLAPKGRGAPGIPDPWLEQALRHLGAPPDVGVEVQADAPPGAGLGGSGSLLVALAHALALARGERPAARELAEEAFRVERGLMGRPVGKQDPYAAAYGGVLELRIEPDGSTRPRRLRLPRPLRRALERSLLLADTGRRRDAGAALAIQEEAVSREDVRRALEGIRALGARIARLLEAGRGAALGAAFQRHWALKRRLTSAISTAEAERCLEVALASGARGGKLIGAGGGGFVLLDCGPARAAVGASLAQAGFACRRVALEARGSRAVAAAGSGRRAA